MHHGSDHEQIHQQDLVRAYESGRAKRKQFDLESISAGMGDVPVWLMRRAVDASYSNSYNIGIGRNSQKEGFCCANFVILMIEPRL
jgi:hypothetical protein